jgi:hypothetical protein
MLWARMVTYVTGTVNQELLLRNEYLGRPRGNGDFAELAQAQHWGFGVLSFL